MVCLGNERRSFCCFWGCTQELYFRFFLLTVRVFRFFYGILAHSNIWWSSELNLPIPVHFSSLIPKMSLLLSPAVTTSSTPWFMDLTFQVSMQWCSVQHQMCFHHQTHPQLSIVSTLVQPLHSFWCAKSLQSFPTFCDPMDCSPPGSSVHGVIQARTLEWVAIPSSSGSSRPRDRTHVSYVWCIGRRFLYHWATILSGAISNCSVLLSGNILDTFQPGGLIFWWSFCLFILFMVFSWQEC